MILRASHTARSVVGFTLIELLVVVAIISLLVSILLPSLQQAKDLAKSVLCQTNVRSLMMGQEFYAKDYGVYAAYQSSGSPPIRQMENYIVESGALLNYYGNVGDPINYPPYVCPAEPQAIRTGTGTWDFSGEAQPYGWNTMLGGFTYNNPNPYFEFLSVDEIRRPSELLGWADGQIHGVFYPPWIGWGAAEAHIVPRHQLGSTNYAGGAFLDGHSEQILEENLDEASLYDPSL
jgi:prepilin-type N-terminal cleavage/methylation domain-containing protein